MSETLKPCPFCGSEVFMMKEPLIDYPGYYKFEIYCSNSKCDCAVEIGENRTIHITEKEARINAIKAWNTRAYENA